MLPVSRLQTCLSFRCGCHVARRSVRNDDTGIDVEDHGVDTLIIDAFDHINLSRFGPLEYGKDLSSRQSSISLLLRLGCKMARTYTCFAVRRLYRLA